MKDFTSRPTDIEGTKALIREMGEFFHKEARAEELCEKLDSDLKRVMDAARQRPDTPTVAIIHYGQAMNIYLTIMGQSVAGTMVRWAGGRMALNDSGGMKQLTSPEVLAKANPDVILLTEFGYDRLAGLTDILALPGVAATKAGRTGRIWRIEEHDLIYFGPRTGENVEKLRELIHRPAPSSSRVAAAGP
jgi:iron complex transport system substrate-binding protein